MQAQIALVWEKAPASMHLTVMDGQLGRVRCLGVTATKQGAAWHFDSQAPCRVECQFDAARIAAGAPATRLMVRADSGAFTFFLRDATAANPIWLPHLGVAVTVADDRRDYAAVAADIRRRGLRSELECMAAEPEESFEQAAANTRRMVCETWLGVSRDMRLFKVTPSDRVTFQLRPLFHHRGVPVPETGDQPLEYGLVYGRGCGCVVDLSRHLDDQVLPILHARLRDGDITYDMTAFVGLERTPLTAGALRGTHFLAADGHAAGHMFTPEQQAQFEAISAAETFGRDELTVLFLRVTALNTGGTPRHAFFKSPFLQVRTPSPTVLTPETGAAVFTDSGRAFAVCTLDGAPLPQPEVAVLLQPGATATLHCALPHSPAEPERVARLAGRDFDALLDECRTFWRAKLATAATIDVPDKRISEMLRAGLLHLDLISYGLEPDATVAPCIGVYASIGSESAPIIQFYDSMGWHDLARRSLQYFLDKQHADGFIQNFGGYMLETGPALWCMGEHFQVTRDVDWARRIAPQALKACEYLLAWRRRNQRDDLRGRGYGLIEGKVADPEDHFRQFMLNGYSCLGLQSVSAMLTAIDPAESERLAREADAWKRDIRTALEEAMAESPVIPIGDGTWLPTAPPWAEMRGAAALFVDGQPCYTHGTFAGRDSMIGPMYLFLQHILDAHEPLADALLKTHQVLFTQRNAAFSQPYYARHDIAHLRRGEVNAFLKTYFNQVASLADRETYTFWEHYHCVSSHKTHEEGWFLMQTRWMLWLEEGEALRLLPAVPRAWLADGGGIRLERVGSAFGPFTLHVRPELARNRITAHFECQPARAPATLLLRLPHPDGRRATTCTGGVYRAADELVEVTVRGGTAEVVLHFNSTPTRNSCEKAGER